jgi:hypothetical protein
LLSITIAYNVGCNASIDKAAVKYATNVKIVQDSKLSAINAKIKSQSKYESQLENYIKNKKQFDKQLSDDNSQISDLESKISSEQSELNNLTDSVTAAQTAPKDLPAGQYTVGTDITAGRYSVDGSSNFVVYDSSGSIKVNTILGNSNVGVGTYTCDLSDGDTIKTESETRFTPIS